MDLLDLALSVALGRSRFFAGGWGDVALLESEPFGEVAARPPDAVELELGPAERRDGFLVHSGSFESPEPRLTAGRRVRVRLLEPAGHARAAVLVMAAAGDQGFTVRETFVAPLVRSGTAALLLENPYYGNRRPVGQAGTALRTVSDLALMISTAVREGRALTAWLRSRHGRVGVAGYSMGGQTAALIAEASPFPLAVAAAAPPVTQASVFVTGYLRHVVDLEALGGPEARPLLQRRLSRIDVLALPPPPRGSSMVVVGVRRDGIVPPADPAAIAEHWGAELRWVEAGHVSAVLFHGEALRRAVRDALDGLRGDSAPDGRAAA